MTIKRVRNKDELEELFRTFRLYELYSNCFSSPPYEEKFDTKEVMTIFSKYVNEGILLIILDEVKQICIAFSAALPLEQSESDVIVIAVANGFKPEIDWYEADWGVDVDYRCHGIGTEILKALICEVPSNVILVRTQERNITSKKRHESLGFEVVDGMIQDVKGKRTSGEVLKDRRIFMRLKKG